MAWNILIALLFFVFAAVQFNDPDPWAWVLLYTAVGAAWLTTVWRPVPRPVIVAGLVIVAAWALWLLPDFFNWVKMGMPTIAGSMKAEAPHVELTREFLGLVICAVALSGLWKKSG